MKTPGFFAELKRRNVYKVAVAYAVVAWLLVQAASILFPTFDAPSWVMKVFVALVLLGFPIALILAWAFELTPEGIQRTETAGPRKERSPQLWLVLLVVSGLSAAGIGLWQWQSKPKRPNESSAAAAPEERLKSLAVLPFVNMSGDPANEYFSDGVTEEILNAVAHLPDVRVASRTSAFAFKGKSADVAEIARNLRVTNVLEGSVQRMGERVRITAQLIDAKSGFHLWSEKFDRDAKDLFAVQDEIAQAIARALKLELGGATKERAQRSGTENVASHEAYLKALDASSTEAAATPQRRFEALSFVDQAIALDPKFAAAYALKARILSSFAFGSTDEGQWDRYVAQGEIAAERALELDPNLADAYAAMGEMARRRSDAATAIANFRRAVELKPSDPDVWQWLGVALGFHDPEGSLQCVLKAKELGSTSPYLPRQISYALNGLGRMDEAYATIREQHVAHPEFVPAAIDMGRYELWVRGRPDRALEFFAQAYRQSPTFVDGTVPVSFYPALVYALCGLPDEVSPWLARESAVAPDSVAVAATRLLLAAYDADENALRSLIIAPPENAPAGARAVRLASAAEAALLTGDFARAAEFYRELLNPNDGKGEPNTMRRRRNELCLAYALRKLGQRDEADALLRSGPESFPVTSRYSFLVWSIRPISGIFYTDGELYALRGEKEKSLAALNAALALPDDGLIPVGSLPVPIENSPLLESLRAEPGFASFRQEVARRRAIMKKRVREMTATLRLAAGG